MAVGIALFTLTLMALSVKYFRARKQAAFPAWGPVGLAILLLAELLLFLRVAWVTTFFTPLMWTGYLLLIDAAVWSLQGQSRLGSEPGKVLSLAFWSVPLWLTFEAYNLRLENWTYVGLPENLVVRGVGYVWSFATIWPAIFETADFLRALGLFPNEAKRRTPFSRASHASMMFLGLLFVTMPVLVPARLGQYLFGAVWVGFVLLLEPVNYHWKGRSLLRDLEVGETSTISSFLLAGLVCGILWEFWNYWASAKWLYIFPIGQDWKIFEMPLPGYLGFPAFALECLVMYEFLGTLKNQLLRLRRSPEWGAGGSRP